MALRHVAPARGHRAVGGAWILVALLLACGGSGSDGRPAPDFMLERVGGGQVSLEDLRGKVVLLDFWATWCAPCVKAIPELEALHQAWQDRGFEVVGIAVDDLDEEPLRRWLEEKGVTYTVLRASSDLAASYGAYQFPTHVLLSPRGTILLQMEPGYHSRAELEAAIEPHLAELGPSAGRNWPLKTARSHVDSK